MQETDLSELQGTAKTSPFREACVCAQPFDQVETGSRTRSEEKTVTDET